MLIGTVGKKENLARPSESTCLVLTGIFDNTWYSVGAVMLILNVAFIAGSSKHYMVSHSLSKRPGLTGKALLASVGSN